MISEGSCDTEGLSNEIYNLAVITVTIYILKH